MPSNTASKDGGASAAKPRKFGDSNRSSMAPKGPGNYGPGKIPTAAKAKPSKFGDDRRSSMAPKPAAKKPSSDERRSSMAPKAKPAKPSSNYGPGKIPAAGKPNQGKFDNTAARTAGLGKQGLIKGQPSGAGVAKKPASSGRKGPVDPGNIIKRKPVSANAPVKKKPATAPAKKPVSTGGGGGGRMIAN